MESTALVQSCVSPKTFCSKEYWDWRLNSIFFFLALTHLDIWMSIQQFRCLDIITLLLNLHSCTHIFIQILKLKMLFDYTLHIQVCMCTHEIIYEGVNFCVISNCIYLLLLISSSFHFCCDRQFHLNWPSSVFLWIAADAFDSCMKKHEYVCLPVNTKKQF